MSTPSANYNRFCCPNEACIFYNTPGQGNIAHRSWTGVRKDIERLRCRVCCKEFSSRRGTLQEKAKTTLEQQERMLICLRWGVQLRGIAEICKVDIDTVELFQKKTAERAKIHHDNLVKDIRADGVQLDELYAKMAGCKRWLGVAIAMKSLLILAVTVGARDGKLADKLLAEVWARCLWVGIFLTDGWRPYVTAILKCFGHLFQPRRTSGKGRRKAKRINLPLDLLYGQVVKITNNIHSLVGIKCRAMFGKLKDCEYYIRAYALGFKVHTIHIERWFGTLRSNLACLRRRSRCLVKNDKCLEDRVWVFVSLYNWVICHTTLTLNKIKRTPAMAAGLIDRPLSYQEYIQMPVFACGDVAKRVGTKLQEMSSNEVVKAAQRYKVRPEEKIVWEAPPVTQREVA